MRVLYLDFTLLEYTRLKARCRLLTAYDLFKKVYLHYFGQYMRHLADGQDNIKDHVIESFNESLEEYIIDSVYGSGILLSYYPDKKVDNKGRLQSIEMYDGYFLCHYDGYTGDWMITHFIFKEEAIAERKAWRKYMLYKGQDWLWIVRVGPLI